MSQHLEKIFITGAGGMLGTDLVAALHNSFEVLGAGNVPAPHLPCSYLNIDLSESRNTLAAISAFKPHIILHCAANTDVDAYELKPKELLLQNEKLVDSVVAAANQTKALLIFFSTDYVFDGSKQTAYEESDTLCPINVYGLSKANAETYIQKNAENYAIFRISWLYGIHGKSFPRTIWERLKVQDNFKVVVDQVGRPSFTKDISGAFKDILTSHNSPLDRLKQKIFHLGNQGETSWANLAEYIISQDSHHCARVEKIFSTELSRAAKRPKNSVLALGKAERELGIRLRSWEPAVSEFLTMLAKE